MEKDILREMAINQGYVKQTCQLPGALVMALINSGETPCAGCNIKNMCKETE